ncbi:hypothetical protein PY257_13120 [Ramlibacter sp. H39-3-26]|uniref:hypothetical protein n=1 Tax=Curvibacter soli TaxID=3031331 RepID=UPI0023DB9F33|nr:hypothetical protein [Ramlibacter sp. H39-3-26]MDF1486109.1 hypothetical protein [Ramlibacter sp. H39-3-26]
MTAMPGAQRCASFLRAALPAQAKAVASYPLDGQTVWLKKAPPITPPWRYALLGLIARLLRLDVLQPVTNPGGAAAIAQEARRLRELAALGLRVPAVLAAQGDALLLADVGSDPARPTRMLAREIETLLPVQSTEAVALWRQGLEGIALVHARGTYLSQAFARNLVRCADGAIAYLDFEDDPGATLSLTECQARDWLCYVHSTALLLQTHGATASARPQWHAVLQAHASAPVRAALRDTVRRLAWMRHLPAGRVWGRDTQCLRAAARFLAP